MTKLRVAPDLSLPLDVVTSTNALLAKRGSGKTYTASVLAEEMLKAKLPIVVVDPTGAWWGLRSSADGKGPGFPVVVFGGDHADIALNETSGEDIARFVVEQRPPGVIIDRSHMKKAEGVRFMLPFIETLYRLNREPLHLFWDECDTDIPQKPMADQTRLLGAAEDLVRRGRIKGLGVSLITQRPAVVNKDVLTQTETLIVMRMVGPQDVEAVKAWVKQHDLEGVAPEMLASLPSLPIGDSWWWSPGFLEIFQHTRVRQRETFDSSRTPKVGEKVRPPKVIAPVDLERLREKFAAAIEKAKADDPKTLRAEIARLKADLAKATSLKSSAPAPAKMTPEERAALRLEGARVMAKGVATLLPKVDRLIDKFGGTAVRDLTEWQESMRGAVGDIAKALTEKAPEYSQAAPAMPSTPLSRRVRPNVERPRSIASSNGDERASLTRGEQRILDALAELEATGTRPATRTQVGVVASLNLSGGSGSTYVGHLTQLGLVTIPAPAQLELTETGHAQAAPAPTALTNDEMLQRALAKLNGGERRILEHLAAIYPREASRADVGSAVNLNLSGGSGSTYVGKLTTLNFAEIPSPGLLRASDLLFPEGA